MPLGLNVACLGGTVPPRQVQDSAAETAVETAEGSGWLRRRLRQSGWLRVNVVHGVLAGGCPAGQPLRGVQQPVEVHAGKLADLLSQKIFRQLRLPLWTLRLLVFPPCVSYD